MTQSIEQFSNSREKTKEQGEVDLEKFKIKQKYGIDIHFSEKESKEEKVENDDEEEEKNEEYESKYIKTDLEESNNKLELLKNIKLALSIYGKDFLKEVGLKSISLYKTIKEEKTYKNDGKVLIEDVGGLASGRNISIAFTFEGENLSTEDILHHEIFHILDIDLKKDNEKLLEAIYDVNKKYKYNGDNWKKLEERPKGFISKYASKSPNEDQAETYAYMITGKLIDGKTIWELAKNDKVLEVKINEMEKNFPQLKELLGINRGKLNSKKEETNTSLSNDTKKGLKDLKLQIR